MAYHGRVGRSEAGLHNGAHAARLNGGGTVECGLAAVAGYTHGRIDQALDALIPGARQAA